MQCKDIPDEVFLDAVRIASSLTGGGWAMYWDVGCVLAGHDYHLTIQGSHAAYPNGECFPWRLVLAKARKLIDRGAMDGCPCGCRGDFEIPGDRSPDIRSSFVTQTGKVYVAPLGPIDWEKRGWKELGYTTDDGILSIDPAEPPVITVGRVHELKVPDLSSLDSAFRSITVSFKATLDALRSSGFLFWAPARRRPERIRRMRSAYRQKRGRRRFR